jgi:hypothetical protein
LRFFFLSARAISMAHLRCFRHQRKRNFFFLAIGGGGAPAADPLRRL